MSKSGLEKYISDSGYQAEIQSRVQAANEVLAAGGSRADAIKASEAKATSKSTTGGGTPSAYGGVGTMGGANPEPTTVTTGGLQDFTGGGTDIGTTPTTLPDLTDIESFDAAYREWVNDGSTFYDHRDLFQSQNEESENSLNGTEGTNVLAQNKEAGKKDSGSMSGALAGENATPAATNDKTKYYEDNAALVSKQLDYNGKMLNYVNTHEDEINAAYGDGMADKFREAIAARNYDMQQFEWGRDLTSVDNELNGLTGYVDPETRQTYVDRFNNLIDQVDAQLTQISPESELYTYYTAWKDDLISSRDNLQLSFDYNYGQFDEQELPTLEYSDKYKAKAAELAEVEKKLADEKAKNYEGYITTVDQYESSSITQLERERDKLMIELADIGAEEESDFKDNYANAAKTEQDNSFYRRYYNELYDSATDWGAIAEDLDKQYQDAMRASGGVENETTKQLAADRDNALGQQESIEIGKYTKWYQYYTPEQIDNEISIINRTYLGVADIEEARLNRDNLEDELNQVEYDIQLLEGELSGSYYQETTDEEEAIRNGDTYNEKSRRLQELYAERTELRNEFFAADDTYNKLVSKEIQLPKEEQWRVSALTSIKENKETLAVLGKYDYDAKEEQSYGHGMELVFRETEKALSDAETAFYTGLSEYAASKGINLTVEEAKEKYPVSGGLNTIERSLIGIDKEYLATERGETLLAAYREAQNEHKLIGNMLTTDLMDITGNPKDQEAWDEAVERGYNKLEVYREKREETGKWLITPMTTERDRELMISGASGVDKASLPTEKWTDSEVDKMAYLLGRGYTQEALDYGFNLNEKYNSTHVTEFTQKVRGWVEEKANLAEYSQSGVTRALNKILIGGMPILTSLPSAALANIGDYTYMLSQMATTGKMQTADFLTLGQVASIANQEIISSLDSHWGDEKPLSFLQNTPEILSRYSDYGWSEIYQSWASSVQSLEAMAIGTAAGKAIASAAGLTTKGSGVLSNLMDEVFMSFGLTPGAANTWAASIAKWYVDSAFFFSSAVDGIKNAKARGLSDDRALLLGSLNGVAEAAGEEISMDFLLGWNPVSTLGRVVQFFGSNETEGTEEGFTEILNFCNDYIVNWDTRETDIYKWHDEAIEAGLSEEAACHRAYRMMMNQITDAYIQGTLSPGLSAGYKLAMNTARTYSVGKSYNAIEAVGEVNRGVAPLAADFIASNTADPTLQTDAGQALVNQAAKFKANADKAQAKSDSAKEEISSQSLKISEELSALRALENPSEQQKAKIEFLANEEQKNNARAAKNAKTKNSIINNIEVGKFMMNFQQTSPSLFNAFIVQNYEAFNAANPIIANIAVVNYMNDRLETSGKRVELSNGQIGEIESQLENLLRDQFGASSNNLPGIARNLESLLRGELVAPALASKATLDGVRKIAAKTAELIEKEPSVKQAVINYLNGRITSGNLALDMNRPRLLIRSDISEKDLAKTLEDIWFFYRSVASAQEQLRIAEDKKLRGIRRGKGSLRERVSAADAKRKYHGAMTTAARRGKLFVGEYTADDITAIISGLVEGSSKYDKAAKPLAALCNKLGVKFYGAKGEGFRENELVVAEGDSVSFNLAAFNANPVFNDSGYSTVNTGEQKVEALIGAMLTACESAIRTRAAAEQILTLGEDGGISMTPLARSIEENLPERAFDAEGNAEANPVRDTFTRLTARAGRILADTKTETKETAEEKPKETRQVIPPKDRLGYKEPQKVERKPVEQPVRQSVEDFYKSLTDALRAEQDTQAVVQVGRNFRYMAVGYYQYRQSERKAAGLPDITMDEAAAEFKALRTGKMSMKDIHEADAKLAKPKSEAKPTETEPTETKATSAQTSVSEQTETPVKEESKAEPQLSAEDMINVGNIYNEDEAEWITLAEYERRLIEEAHMDPAAARERVQEEFKFKLADGGAIAKGQTIETPKENPVNEEGEEDEPDNGRTGKRTRNNNTSRKSLESGELETGKWERSGEENVGFSAGVNGVLASGGVTAEGRLKLDTTSYTDSDIDTAVREGRITANEARFAKEARASGVAGVMFVDGGLYGTGTEKEQVAVTGAMIRTYSYKNSKGRIVKEKKFLEHEPGGYIVINTRSAQWERHARHELWHYRFDQLRQRSVALNRTAMRVMLENIFRNDEASYYVMLANYAELGGYADAYGSRDKNGNIVFNETLCDAINEEFLCDMLGDVSRSHLSVSFSPNALYEFSAMAKRVMQFVSLDAVNFSETLKSRDFMQEYKAVEEQLRAEEDKLRKLNKSRRRNKAKGIAELDVKVGALNAEHYALAKEIAGLVGQSQTYTAQLADEKIEEFNAKQLQDMSETTLPFGFTAQNTKVEANKVIPGMVANYEYILDMMRASNGTQTAEAQENAKLSIESDIEKFDALTEEEKTVLKDNDMLVYEGMVLNSELAKTMAAYGEQARPVSYDEPEKYSIETMDVWESLYTNTKYGQIAINDFENASAGVISAINAFNQAVMNQHLDKYIAHGSYNTNTMGPIRTNSDQYYYTFDMDTSCSRSLMFNDIRDEIQKQKGRELTENEAINLLYLMRSWNARIPCIYCYVEGKRRMKSQYYLNFLDYRNTIIEAMSERQRKNYSHDGKTYADRDTYIRSLMYGVKKETVKEIDGKSVVVEVELNKASEEVLGEWLKAGKSLFKYDSKQAFKDYNNARNLVFNYLDQRYGVFDGKAHNEKGEVLKLSDMTYTQIGTDGKEKLDKKGRPVIKKGINLSATVRDIGALAGIKDFKADKSENSDVYAMVKDFVTEWMLDMAYVETRPFADVKQLHTYYTANDRSKVIEPGCIEPEKLRVGFAASNYASSASQARGVENYEPYAGQMQEFVHRSRKKSKDIGHLYDTINAGGGFRKHSSNDFRIEYIVDYFQLFADFAKYGWKGHTYTKSEAYCRIFGTTGDRINVSIAFTTEEDPETGKVRIRENSNEGMAWASAKKFRDDYADIGTMAMVTDNAQLSYALNSEWVDMIIPFHSSGIPKEVWYDMNAWFDFSGGQHELAMSSDEKWERMKADGFVDKDAKKPDGDKKAGTTTEGLIDEMFQKNYAGKNADGKEYADIYLYSEVKSKPKDYKGDGYKKATPHFMPGAIKGEYFRKLKDGTYEAIELPGHDNDKDAYLKLCAEYFVHPRFDGTMVEYITEDGSKKLINVTEHPNYGKLIKETARTDSPQRAIEFTFNQPDVKLGTYKDENGITQTHTPMTWALHNLKSDSLRPNLARDTQTGELLKDTRGKVITETGIAQLDESGNPLRDDKGIILREPGDYTNDTLGENHSSSLTMTIVKEFCKNYFGKNRPLGWESNSAAAIREALNRGKEVEYAYETDSANIPIVQSLGLLNSRYEVTAKNLQNDETGGSMLVLGQIADRVYDLLQVTPEDKKETIFDNLSKKAMAQPGFAKAQKSANDQGEFDYGGFVFKVENGKAKAVNVSDIIYDDSGNLVSPAEVFGEAIAAVSSAARTKARNQTVSNLIFENGHLTTDSTDTDVMKTALDESAVFSMVDGAIFPFEISEKDRDTLDKVSTIYAEEAAVRENMDNYEIWEDDFGFAEEPRLIQTSSEKPRAAKSKTTGGVYIYERIPAHMYFQDKAYLQINDSEEEEVRGEEYLRELILDSLSSWIISEEAEGINIDSLSNDELMELADKVNFYYEMYDATLSADAVREIDNLESERRQIISLAGEDGTELSGLTEYQLDVLDGEYLRKVNDLWSNSRYYDPDSALGTALISIYNARRDIIRKEMYLRAIDTTELFKRAEEIFPRLEHPDKISAGFVFPDGYIADVGMYGHTQISAAYPGILRSSRDAVNDAIGRGAIRFEDDFSAIMGMCISPTVRPTYEQRQAIRDRASYLENSPVRVEVMDTRGTLQSQTYANVEQALNGMDRYYTTGMLTQPSSLSAFYSMSEETDNLGNYLSTEQVEYFKDSMARDENGNLLVLYHGAENPHTVFDPSAMDDGASFFLTTALDVAMTYSGGGVVTSSNNQVGGLVPSVPEETYLRIDGIERALNYHLKGNDYSDYDKANFREALSWVQTIRQTLKALENPSSDDYKSFEDWGLILDELGNTLASYTELSPYAEDGILDNLDLILSEMFYARENNKLPRYGYVTPMYAKVTNPLIVDALGANWNAIRVPKEWGAGLSHPDSIRDAGGGYITTNTRSISEYARKNGYDGVIIRNVRDSGPKGFANTFEIENRYEPSTLVITYQSNQTKDIDNLTPTDAPEFRFSMSEETDNLGRRLTVNQAEFYANSQARDENGNLLHLFRGTGSLHYEVDIEDRDEKAMFLTSQQDAAESYLPKGSSPYRGSVAFYKKAIANMQEFAKVFEDKVPAILDISDSATVRDAIDEVRKAIDYNINAFEQNRNITTDSPEYDMLSGIGKDAVIKPLRSLRPLLEEAGGDGGIIVGLNKTLSGLTFLTDVASDIGRAGRGFVSEMYVNLENPLILDCTGMYGTSIRVPSEWTKYMSSFSRRDREDSIIDKKDGTSSVWTVHVVQYAKANGYDGVIFKNIDDTAFGFGGDSSATVVAVFKPNQVKDVENLDPTDANGFLYSIADEDLSAYDSEAVSRISEYAAEHAQYSKAEPELFTAATDMMGRVNSLIYFSGGDTYGFALRHRLNPIMTVEYDGNLGRVAWLNNPKAQMVDASRGDLSEEEFQQKLDSAWEQVMQNDNSIFIGDVRDAEKGIEKLAGLIYHFHASPVCCNYSNASSKTGDTSLDMMTAKSTADTIRKVKPRVFTLENVASYKKSKALGEIIDALRAEGYGIYMHNYDSADYGAPTSRKRLFLTAIKGATDEEVEALAPIRKEDKLPRSKRKTWNEIILPLLENPMYGNEVTELPKYMQERLNTLDELSQYGVDFLHSDADPIVIIGGNRGGGLTIRETGKPYNTITTKGGDARIIIPGETPRFFQITPAGMAKLQGLEGYNLPWTPGVKGGKTFSYKVIGNGIPPQLTQAVVEPVLNYVLEEDRAAAMETSKLSIDEPLTPNQEKNYIYNQKQTVVGSPLKTLNGSTIGRYRNKVGKMMDALYVHRNYTDQIDLPGFQDNLSEAERILAETYPDYEYRCIKYAPKKNTIAFQSAPDFDTAREPRVGDYVAVNYQTGTAAWSDRGGNYIWHHKWNWVMNDYEGFDVEESWNWSKEWLSTIRETSDGNGIARWNAQLDKYDLPHDTEPISRFSLAAVDPIIPTSNAWKPGEITLEQFKERFPLAYNGRVDEGGMTDEEKEKSKKHDATQRANTINTYEKLYKWIKTKYPGVEPSSVTILDASSGLGLGTELGIDTFGFNVEDVEPYPDLKSHKPTYSDYSTLHKQYDVIISSVVLNVLQQDQRDAMLVKFKELLKPGGYALITVRSSADTDVGNLRKNAVTDEELVKYPYKNVEISNGEFYVGRGGVYQKGFTQEELHAYVQDAFGPGYTVMDRGTGAGKSGLRDIGTPTVVVEKNKESSDDYNDSKFVIPVKSAEVETDTKYSTADFEPQYFVEGMTALRDEMLRIDAARSWTGEEIQNILKAYPEIDFVERIYNGDRQAIPDLEKAIAGADIDTLSNIKWYLPKSISYLERDKYRGSITKFNRVLNKALENVMNANKPIVGRDLGIKSEAVSYEYIKNLFYELNTDEGNLELANKVFGYIEDRPLAFKPDLKFKKLGSADPTDKQFFGQHDGKKVRYSTPYFNSEYVSDQDKANTILHELIHQITSYALWIYENEDAIKRMYGYILSPDMRGACKTLNIVWEQIRYDSSMKDSEGEPFYGLTNPREMVAELSEPEFRSALKKKNLFQAVVDAIKKILGIEVNTAYDAASAAFDALLDSFDYDYDNDAQRTFMRFVNAKPSYADWKKETTETDIENDAVYSLADKDTPFTKLKDMTEDQIDNAAFLFQGKTLLNQIWSGEKTIETRGSQHTLDNWLGKRVGIAMPNKDRTAYDLLGYVTFGEERITYSTADEYRADADRHRIGDTGAYKWNGKTRYGYEIVKAEKLDTPIEIPADAACYGMSNARYATAIDISSATNPDGAKFSTNPFQPGSFNAKMYDAFVNGDINDIDNLMNTANSQGNKPRLYGNTYLPMSQDQKDATIRWAEQTAAVTGAMPLGDNPNPNPYVIQRADITQPGEPKRKTRSVVKNVVNAPNISDEGRIIALRERMQNDKLTYVPIHNKDSLSKAKDDWEEWVHKYGDQALNHGFASVKKLYELNRIPTADQLALTERVLIEAFNAKDYNKAMDLLVMTSIVGTELGQAVQAFRMLREASPISQLYYLQKVVDRLNKRYAERIAAGKLQTIKLDPTLVTRAYAAMNTGDTAQITAAMEALKQNIAEQLPVSWMDRWNAWRYLAMLGNFRTHIRNIFGNVASTPAALISDILAATAQSMFIKKEYRTRDLKEALTPAILSKYHSLAKDQAELLEADLRGSGKVSMEADVMNARKIFKNPALEWLRIKNGGALEFEDWLFLKWRFEKVFAEYLGAKDYNSLSDKEKEKTIYEAQMFAIKEAHKATYREVSKAANAINQLRRQGGAAGFMIDAAIPFVRTPINILKRGIAYSPVGFFDGIKDLIKSLRALNNNDSAETRQGITDAIDKLCEGLTGSMILVVGWVLSRLGLLRAAGGDDDEQNQFDELQGYQDYALILGDKTYTIDWLAPVSLPLFVGAAIEENSSRRFEDYPFVEYLQGFTNILEPMISLSMLDGVNNLFSSMSYADENARVWTFLIQLTTSYASQGLWTLGAQVERIRQDNQQRTYVDKNSAMPDWVQRFLQTTTAKVPFLSDKINTPGATKVDYVDKWGRRKDGIQNAFWRAAYQLFSPGYLTEIQTTAVDEELQRLSDALGGDKTVFPDSPTKTLTFNRETISLTGEEYVKAQEVKGQTAFTELANLFALDWYKNLEPEAQQAAVEQVYSYANEKAKAAIIENYVPEQWTELAETIGVGEYAIFNKENKENKSIEDSVDYIINNANLSHEQQAVLIADQISPGDYVYSPDDESIKYELLNDGLHADDDRFDEICRDLYVTEYTELMSNADYKKADDDLKREWVMALRTEVKKQAGEALAVEIAEEAKTDDFRKEILTMGNMREIPGIKKILGSGKPVTEQYTALKNTALSKAKSRVNDDSNPGYDIVLTDPQQAQLDSRIDAKLRTDFTNLVTDQNFKSLTDDEQAAKVKDLMVDTADELEEQFISELVEKGEAETDLTPVTTVTNDNLWKLCAGSDWDISEQVSHISDAYAPSAKLKVNKTYVYLDNEDKLVRSTAYNKYMDSKLNSSEYRNATYDRKVTLLAGYHEDALEESKDVVVTYMKKKYF